MGHFSAYSDVSHACFAESVVHYVDDYQNFYGEHNDNEWAGAIE